MISKEEMEKAKECLKSYINAIDTFGTIDYKCINNLYKPIETILKYTTQLETRIKELEEIEAEHKKINGELREEISILKNK